MAIFQHIKSRGKVELEMNLARDVKSNKCFYRYVSQKRKVKESSTPLISNAGRLVTYEEKAEMPGSGFVSVFYGSLFPHLFSGWTARWGLWETRRDQLNRGVQGIHMKFSKEQGAVPNVSTVRGINV